MPAQGSVRDFPSKTTFFHYSGMIAFFVLFGTSGRFISIIMGLFVLLLECVGIFPPFFNVCLLENPARFSRKCVRVLNASTVNLCSISPWVINISYFYIY